MNIRGWLDDHTPIHYPSNRFWAALSIPVRGWVLTIRVRREGERQRYRRWVQIDVFNYNYSEEALESSREGNEILGEKAWPKEGQRQCSSCGQEIPHGHERCLDEVPLDE